MEAKQKESSAHRRARRLRSNARLLGRLAAAVRLLHGHHGSRVPAGALFLIDAAPSSKLPVQPYVVAPSADEVPWPRFDYVAYRWQSSEVVHLCGDWRELPAWHWSKLYQKFAPPRFGFQEVSSVSMSAVAASDSYTDELFMDFDMSCERSVTEDDTRLYIEFLDKYTSKLTAALVARRRARIPVHQTTADQLGVMRQLRNRILEGGVRSNDIVAELIAIERNIVFDDLAPS
eukprot:TRINITY_DN11008_c0_g1_i1.p1 TRINITY_DN11008_c0_g1~~TRINITY_DN11008_c0_g1_i1.p1  ORF type:complete len:232 (+),score=10.65 TRINITY_DN11008_c0_g1_i1:102-797(+)